MFKAKIDTNRIVVTNPDNEIITSGSVNVNFIQFSFSEDWVDLQKTVIFQTKKVTIPIILEGDALSYTMPIPWETTLYANESINVGAYGTRMDNSATLEDEEVILPTVWGVLPDKVRQGVIVTDPTPSSPTYNAYQLLLKTIADLIANGGGGGGGLPGISPTISVTPINGGAVLTIVDVNGEKKITIMNGVDGKDGKDGSDGFSPTVSVTPIEGGNRLTITDVNGEHSFDFLNGQMSNELITFKDKVFSKLSDFGDINFPCCLHLINCHLGGDFNDDIVYVKNSADVLLHAMTVDNAVYEITMDQNGNFVELDVTYLSQKINNVATGLSIQLGELKEELEGKITVNYNPTWVAWSEEDNTFGGSDGPLTNSTLKVGLESFSRVPKFNERGILIIKNRSDEYRLCYCTVARFELEQERVVLYVDYMVRIDRHDSQSGNNPALIGRCVWLTWAGSDLDLFEEGKANHAAIDEFVGHIPTVSNNNIGLILVDNKLYWTEFNITEVTDNYAVQTFTQDPILLGPSPGEKGEKGEKGDTGGKGDPGEPGPVGPAGFSPAVQVEEIDGGHQVTITDAGGTQSFDVMDGGSADGIPVKPITESEYGVLTDNEKNSETAWLVTDANGSGGGTSGFENVYSDEEIVTGTWFGKPLYRKVFQFTTPNNVISSSQLIPGIEIQNVQNAVKIYGKIHSGTVGGLNNQQYVSLPAFFVSGYATFSVAINDDTHVCTPYIYITSETFCNRSGVAILEYTKTTD